MRHVLQRLAIASVIAAGAGSARAAAPPRTSSLGWVRLAGAETCVGAPELARAVERQLGRAVFVSPAQADVLVEGRIEPGAPDAAFRAHIAITDTSGAVLGTRELTTPSASCRALDEQLALVIALLIDPAAVLGPPFVPPAPPAPSVPRAPPAPPAPSCPLVPPCPPAPAPSREPWRGGLGAGVAVAAGLVPDAGVGLMVRGEVAPPWLVPVQLGGAVWADTSAETGGKGARLSLSWGSLSVCPLAMSAWGLGLRGCAGAAIGAMRAAGYGVDVSETRETLFAAALIEGRLTRRMVGPLEVGLGLGLVVPFERARVYVVDASGAEQELFQAGAVAAVADAGIGLAFP